MAIPPPQNETPAETRRATLTQFAALPEATQSAFLQSTFEKPELRTNPELLHTAMQTAIEQHVQGQRAIELAALLQLSPQLAPAGRQADMAQQAALEQHAAVHHLAQVEVKQALDRGESAEQIQAKARSTDNVTQAATQSVVQEHKEEKQRTQVAMADEVHREKVGLTAPEQAAHPMAHLVPDHLKAAIGAAFGGAQHGHETEVAMATGGKNAVEANKGRG